MLQYGLATDHDDASQWQMGYGESRGHVPDDVTLAWKNLPPEMKTSSLTPGQFSSQMKTEMLLRS